MFLTSAYTQDNIPCEQDNFMLFSEALTVVTMTTPSLDWPLNPENTHSGHRLEPEISAVFPGKPWATSRVLWAQNGSCQWHNSSKQWEEISASLASHSPSHEWEKSRFLSWTLWSGWNLPGGRSDMALATETVSNRSLTRGQVKNYNVAPTYLGCLQMFGCMMFNSHGTTRKDLKSRSAEKGNWTILHM